MGRSRSRRLQGRLAPRHARFLLLLGDLDDEDRVLAGQTDQHHETDLREDVHFQPAGSRADGAQRHIGTTRMTASGSDQLS